MTVIYFAIVELRTNVFFLSKISLKSIPPPLKLTLAGTLTLIGFTNFFLSKKSLKFKTSTTFFFYLIQEVNES